MRKLPRGWVRTTVGEVGDVRLGRQRSPKNHSGSRMVPYVRAANITWTGLALDDVKEMNFTEAESAIYELRSGDVLLAEASGSASEVGKPAIWGGEIPGCCFQNTVIRVRPKAADSVYLTYYFLLQARSGRLGDAAKGVGIHHIGANRLSAFPLPLPPLEEQRRIVAAIEEQFSRLDAADASLLRASELLAVLKEQVLDEVVHAGPLVRLGDVATAFRYGTSAKCSASATEGTPVLRIPNVRDGRIDLSDLKWLPGPAASLGDCVVRKDDLVAIRTNGSRSLIGRVARITTDAPLGFASYLIRFTPMESLDPAFAVQALSAPSTRVEIERAAASTAGQYNLNTKALQSLEIPLPPLHDQQRIVAEVEQRLSVIDAMAAAITSAQKKSAALRRAILDRAFRGELVPQSPSDEPASVLLERIRAQRAATTPPKRRRRAAANGPVS